MLCARGVWKAILAINKCFAILSECYGLKAKLSFKFQRDPIGLETALVACSCRENYFHIKGNALSSESVNKFFCKNPNTNANKVHNIASVSSYDSDRGYKYPFNDKVKPWVRFTIATPTKRFDNV